MAKTAPKTGLAARYTKAQDVVLHQPRIIAALYGEVGTLKTSFALGARTPILVIDGDQGLEGVIEPMLEKGREIYVERFSSNVSELRAIDDDTQRAAEAEKIATQIEDAFYDAIEQGIKSIIIDKESQLYDIVKFAMLGGQESDNPNRFYPIHQRLSAMIEAAKASDINLLLIQGMKTPWGQEMKQNGKIGGKPLKDRVRRGWGQLEEHVHMNIEHIMRKNDAGVAEFFLNIGKVRGPGGRNLQYTEIPYSALESEGDEDEGIYPFTRFAMEVFPDTTPEDWK